MDQEIAPWTEKILSSMYTVLSMIFFCELTRGKKLRSRGPNPALADQEVITMQIVGEFLGMDSDKGIWEYFYGSWRSLFPKIGDRSAFVRQAANLNYWIQRLQDHIARKLGSIIDQIHITDGFPIPVVHFKRAHFSKIFKGEASYGYCASKSESYYGFKGHLVITGRGVISHFTFAAANIDERDIVPENVAGIQGKLLGDKGFIRPSLTSELAAQGIQLEHLNRSNMKELRSSTYLTWIGNTRRLVETVISQLSERFNIQKVRARDLWHLSLRLSRKILSHTIAVFLNVSLGRPVLQCEGLVM